MLNFLIEPWLLGEWMWRGTLAGLLVASICAPLGVFLYLRRMSMLSDALSHAALPGIVAAFLLSGSVHPLAMLAGAAATGWCAALTIEGISKIPGVRSDSAIGVVFTAFFAVGVIGVSRFGAGAHIDADCVLYGDILGVSDSTLGLLSLVVMLVGVGILGGFRWLALSSFDPRYAAVIGVPVVLVHHALMTGVSLATVASFEAVGAILVIAFFAVPAATAHLLSRRLHVMLMIALGHALLSVIVGMYGAIAMNVSAAGAIVVVQGILYALTLIFAPVFGLIATLRAQNGSNPTLRRRWFEAIRLP